MSATCVLLAVTWIALVGVATSMGTVSLPAMTTLQSLARALGLPAGNVLDWQYVVITTIRLPRVCVAAVAGGGLAVAGAAMQGLFRNPMADPGIVGVSGGAALGSVTALYLGSHALGVFWVPAAAFAGAMACAYLVYGLSTFRGQTPVTSLLLAGVAVGSIAAALTSFVLSISLANWEVGRQMMSWLMGGLEGRGWLHFIMSAPLIVAGSLWLYAYSRDLNALMTGEESALSLGVDVVPLKRRLIALCSLVTAATVSVMGVVSFVGLMIPHIARLIVGSDFRRLLPVSFAMGSLFLVGADLLCRMVADTHDLRLGVVTSLFGGPFFLYLLLRNRRAVLPW